jgi:flagellar biosynthesis/type III secretory pathway protein FliH
MVRVIKASEMSMPGRTKAVVLDLRDLAAQAREIILDSRKEAAAILAGAKTQAAKIKVEAAQAGQAEGFARGTAQGTAQGAAQAHADAEAQLQAQTAELVDLAKAIVAQLAAAKDQALAHMRQDMLNLSLQLASKIVGQIAVSDIGAARANLEKVLQLCSGGGEIVLKVNPGQLRRLQAHCGELTEALAVQGPVRLLADESVGPGGVKLISGSGEIDATIETQLANLANGLVGGMGGLFEQPPAAESSADGKFVHDAAPLADFGEHSRAAGQGTHGA